MKILDAILNVDRSKNNSDTVDFNDCGYNFGLSEPENFYEHIKGYWLVRWLCTDAWVGIKAIYFDDIPIGLWVKRERKSSATVEFISTKAYDVLYKFILNNQSNKVSNISLLDLDQNIEETYSIGYSEQILDKVGVYEGEIVEITWQYLSVALVLKKTSIKNKTWDKFHSIVVKTMTNEYIIIDCRKIEFLLGLNKE